MFTTWEYISAVFVVAIAYILYGYWANNYFWRKHICYLEPDLPLAGNMMDVTAGREHIKDLVNKLYESFREQKYFGFIRYTKPIVVVKDLDLIKKIAIDDFEYFQDHICLIDEQFNPLSGNSLFSMKGQKWNEMRKCLSPAFNKNSMVNMFPLIMKCCNSMINYFIIQTNSESKNYSSSGKKELHNVDMNAELKKYSNDIAASCGFGIGNQNSFMDKDNKFYSMTNKILRFSFIRTIKYLLYKFLPTIIKKYDVHYFNAQISAFYKDLVLGNIKAREENNFVRPDMIQLLKEVKRIPLNHCPSSNAVPIKDNNLSSNQKSHSPDITESKQSCWTDDEITAQAMFFIFNGFESSHSLTSFMAYELATHPEIQLKLQGEIDDLLLKNNGNVTCDDIYNMKFMDMVVSETLRKWPPVVLTDRVCVRSYQLPPPDGVGKLHQIEVGHGIWIPIYSVHHDPEHFKNPETFDPERFSEENETNIKPFTYMPFGVGARNCIASRFALMTTKTLMFSLLSSFDLVKEKSTQMPLKLKTNITALEAESGITITLRLRKPHSN